MKLSVGQLEHAEPGVRLRVWRTFRGLSRSELARRAGCSHTAIAKLEGPRSNPHIRLAFAISKALSVSVELIWRDRATRA
jgi:DNA-binding XRE family transcriptional regulator